MMCQTLYPTSPLAFCTFIYVFKCNSCPEITPRVKKFHLLLACLRIENRQFWRFLKLFVQFRPLYLWSSDQNKGEFFGAADSFFRSFHKFFVSHKKRKRPQSANKDTLNPKMANTQASRPGGASNNAGGGAAGGRLAQFKLVLLGESAVGKSSLVLRFVKGQFHEFQVSFLMLYNFCLYFVYFWVRLFM